MALTEHLDRIFNEILSLARLLLDERGYVFSVTSDIAGGELRIRVVDRRERARVRGATSSSTSVRRVGRSPYGTTIPVQVAEAMGLNVGDRVSWFILGRGAFVSKA